MSQQFRKKPVVIDAVQFTGENIDDIRAFTGDPKLLFNKKERQCFIRTSEGEMTANANDWIIKGVKGEFYPCKPDIFAATYETA